MEKHGLPAVYNALMSGFGEEIGSGDIRFIQDIGQKLEGTPYLDKNTNKLYLCVSTTNSTNNDSSFMRFDMKEAFTKLQNLDKTYDIIYCGRHVNNRVIKVPKKYHNISILLSHGAGAAGLIYDSSATPNTHCYPLEVSYCGSMVQARNLNIYGIGINRTTGSIVPLPSVCETVLIFDNEDNDYMYFRCSGGGSNDNTLMIVCN